MLKEINFKQSAEKKLIDGVDELANAVKSTLGAAGRTVIIEDAYGNPLVTKDGVTVANNILLDESVGNMANLIVRQAAKRTATEAGDGTTTATLLAQSLVVNGKEKLGDKFLHSELKLGIDSAVKDVVKYLKSTSIKVTDEKLIDVATISANNDPELGKLIAEAFIQVGENGVVTMEESATSNTYVSYSEGMDIERGYLSQRYVTDTKKDQCVLDKPLVLLSDVKIQRIEQVMPLVNYALENNRALFIVSDMEDNVLNTFTINRMNGMAVAVIKPPMFGVKRKALLDDMADLCGAKLISEETGDDFSNITFEWLGEFNKVSIGRTKTTMIATEQTQAVIDKINNLKDLLKVEESEGAKEFILERIAKLDGGVGIIHVGASSEAELKEKKDRVDDAISATKAALEEGIVSGGGVALYDASFKVTDPVKQSRDFKIGVGLVVDACRQPIQQILANAGETVEEVLLNIDTKAEGTGYDVKSRKYGNMIDIGIIDPVKVTRRALENAASVSNTILSTNVVITNKKD